MIPYENIFQYNLHNFLTIRKSQIETEILNSDESYILNVSEDEYCEYIFSKYACNVPEIYYDRIEIIDKNEKRRTIREYGRKASIDELSIIFAIPFDGDSEFFRYGRTRVGFSASDIRIVLNEIHLTYLTHDHDKEKFERKLSKDIENFQEVIRWLEK
jgi:hypothetical protein